MILIKTLCGFFNARPCLGLVCSLGVIMSSAIGVAAEPALNDGDRIVIIGDDAVAENKWTHYLSAYMILRNPDKLLHIQTEGTDGAKVADYLSGRYAERVLPYEPDHVIAQFGSSEVVDKASFKTALNSLLDTRITANQLGGNADPILIAPSPAILPGGGANHASYESAMNEIATARGIPFAPVWSDLQASFTSSGNIPRLRSFDGFTAQPNTAGHILMAKSVIEGLGWGTDVSSAIVNAATLTADKDQCDVTDITANEYDGVDFVRLDHRLPWTFDAQRAMNDGSNWDDALEVDPSLADWQQYTLTVKNLVSGDYEILMDDIWVGELNHTQLAAGWNMADLRWGSVWEKSQEVLGRVRDMHNLQRTRLVSWDRINSIDIPAEEPNKVAPPNRPSKGVNRYQIDTSAAYASGSRNAALITASQTALAEIDALDREIHFAAQPEPIRFSIRRKGAKPYTPPVGIPAPDFGINEQAGSFTHYVDNTHPDATDEANEFGTPAKPRKTFPQFPGAGSVIEIHGGPYEWDFGRSRAGEGALVGTQSQPIFVRGADPNNRPTVWVAPRGVTDDNYNMEWVIIENLKFDFSRDTVYNGPSWNVYPGSHHVSVRRCWFTGCAPNHKRAQVNVVCKNDTVWEDRIQDVVFYQCEWSGNAETQPLYEMGIQSTSVNNSSERIWLLSCNFYREPEDGCHMAYVGGNGPIDPADGGKEARLIYVGACRFTECGENGIDIKNARDVIISSNVFRHFPNWLTTGANGEAIVINDEGDNDRIWLLNNHFINCLYGASSQNSQPLDGLQDVYIIGNLYENSPRQLTEDQYNGGGYAFVGISFSGYFMNNTLVKMANGFYCRGSALGSDNTTPNVFIRNNIFYNRLEQLDGEDVETGTQRGLVAEQSGNIAYPTFRELGNTDWSSVRKVDPKFVIPELNEGLLGFHDKTAYRLREESPARDAGDSDLLPFQIYKARYGIDINVDALGVARPNGDGLDIGAMEYDSDAPPPVIPPIDPPSLSKPRMKPEENLPPGS